MKFIDKEAFDNGNLWAFRCDAVMAAQNTANQRKPLSLKNHKNWGKNA